MLPISIARIIAFGITAAVACTLSKIHFFEFMVVIALSHYMVALIYSKRQIANAFGRLLPGVGTIGLIGSAVVFFITKIITLSALFLPHHVLNEVYLTRKEVFKGKEESFIWLLPGACALNVSMFCMLTKLDSWGFEICGRDLNEPLFWFGVAWVGITLSALLIMRTITFKTAINACVLEVLFLIAVECSAFCRISIRHIVLYHVLFWGIYPTFKMCKRTNLRPLITYAIWTAGTILLALVVSPILHLPGHLSLVQLESLFTFSSMLHIMTSIAFSKAQPEWIWRMFQPAENQTMIATKFDEARPLAVAGSVSK